MIFSRRLGPNGSRSFKVELFLPNKFSSIQSTKMMLYFCLVVPLFLHFVSCEDAATFSESPLVTSIRAGARNRAARLALSADASELDSRHPVSLDTPLHLLAASRNFAGDEAAFVARLMLLQRGVPVDRRCVM